MRQAIDKAAGQRQQVRGELHLRFLAQELTGKTILSDCQQRPPLQVIRAFPIDAGGTLVHLHNLSGGVLGGDELAMTVTIGANAYVQLTTTGATRIYRCSPQRPAARQTTRIKVEEGGLLEYLPDPLIPFAEARYLQKTEIELASGAGLFWWETLAPGRTARNELFSYQQMRLETSITAQGRAIAIEQAHLEPARFPLTSPARLGNYYYISTFYICRVGIEAARWSSLEEELSQLARQRSSSGNIIWGVSTLTAHGLLVRALSRQGWDITAGLISFWQIARKALYGQAVQPPRKIY